MMINKLILYVFLTLVTFSLNAQVYQIKKISGRIGDASQEEVDVLPHNTIFKNTMEVDFKLFDKNKKAYLELVSCFDSGNMLYGFNGYYLVDLQKNDDGYTGQNDLITLKVRKLNKNEFELIISKAIVYSIPNIFNEDRNLIYEIKDMTTKVTYKRAFTENDEKSSSASAELFANIVKASPKGSGIVWRCSLLTPSGVLQPF